MSDAENLSRVARFMVVEKKVGYGSPPEYDAAWQPVWGVKVDRIEINRDDRPSTATIWLPALRWGADAGIQLGDRIRIRTDAADPDDRTTIISGFATAFMPSFSGGNEQGGAYERNAVVVTDHRWLMSITSPIYGIHARGPDDYTYYGTPAETAVADSAVFLSGRRCIFNENGKPNRDPTLLQVRDASDLLLCSTPIFADPLRGQPWTSRQMLLYILSPISNLSYSYYPIEDPSLLVGLDHEDFDRVLNHVIIDGLNVLEAVAIICRQLGFGFREDYDTDGVASLVFYKIGATEAYSRSTNDPTIRQQLHAPAVGETISTAVAEGRRMLWSMDLGRDIGGVINNPWGLGAPHRFEFTAELVPAWADADMSVDTSNPYLTEAELQAVSSPNAYSFYSYYHIRGNDFRRNVGRKWALNETGKYSPAAYDRGMPFDFSGIVTDGRVFDADDNEIFAIINADSRRIFAPFARQLLPCLTLDEEALNSLGIIVEFSFDGGSTWRQLPCAIRSLPDECGIWIAEGNLAEIVPEGGAAISGGDLDGVQLNYWTSLADDKQEGRDFSDDEWNTRVRVTASVQMDQRLRRQVYPTDRSGSPFTHSSVYDFTDRYGLNKRLDGSEFYGSGSADERDDYDGFSRHLEQLRDANQDASISGRFTLDRMWLDEGEPQFAVGDLVERITGREYDLSAAMGAATVYPEIVQILYDPEKQKQTLVTRDLRFSLNITI